jgi:hypothetical protein
LKLSALKQRQRGQSNGKRSRGLGEPPSAELFGHQRRYNQSPNLRDDREEAQPHEREPKYTQQNALQEGGHRRIGNKSPVEMTRVAQELQLVPVEAVAPVGCQVQDRHAERHHANA